MATKRKKRPLRPALPSRVKKRTTQEARREPPAPRARSASAWSRSGSSSATLLYLGWDGGVVGGRIVEWLDAAIGGASYVAPVALSASAG